MHVFNSQTLKKRVDMKRILFLALLLGGNFQLIAQSVVGRCETYDDKTGQKESLVEFYKKGDKLYGKMVKLYPLKGVDVNKVCAKCEDERKGKPVQGMEVFRHLRWDGEAWVDGKALHPDHGKEYNLKVWLDPKDSNKLKVRGYLGPFFATQTWIRAKE